MPYKSKNNQKKYQRKYSSFRSKRNSDMRKAVLKGDFGKARQIAQRKPKIHLKKKKRKKGRKK